MANGNGIYYRRTLSKVSKKGDVQTVYSDIDKEFDIEKNDVKLRRNYDSIIQSIWNIILTEKGEMPFLLEFGTDLKRYLFEPMTESTINDIRRDFKEQVMRWEDRINIVEAKIDANHNLGTLTIDLLFTIGEDAFKETFIVGGVSKTPNSTIAENTILSRQ